MIYSVYCAPFLGKYAGEVPEKIGSLIKASSEKDSFIFIVTIRQINDFRSWLTNQKLNDLIQYQSPEPITNGSHPNDGRRLYIFVLSKTEIKESEYVTGINIRGQA